MNIILFHDSEHLSLLPLSFMRPVGELRIGILTFKERWERWAQHPVSHSAESYLQERFSGVVEDENLYIRATILPDSSLREQILKLTQGSALMHEETLIAFHGTQEDFEKRNFNSEVQWKEDFVWLQRPYDFFLHNAQAIEMDYALVTSGRKSAEISSTNGVVGENVFVEEGAYVEYSVLNSDKGYIYIGKNAKVLEGCLIRGSLALCDNATLNMGSKIYGATTIGNHCKVGGEVNNSVLMQYSNKGHEGFLGNSVLGEWCNLGADTNNSNLKNNYGEVKLYHYGTGKFEKTGLQFCGLMMGDHAKSAINTQFNTGTVVGPFANVFHSGFPPNKIEAFSWGGNRGAEKFKLDAALEMAEKMMQRRGIDLQDSDRSIIQHLYNMKS
ncbi:MAG: GlmU family protein [Weeksellaceae bacterium]|nr:GlmU family protein [Weeksellaceae bacterium]